MKGGYKGEQRRENEGEVRTYQREE